MANILIFDVADVVCALPVDAIQEVLALPNLSRPPQVPAMIEGFFNLRGQIATVLRVDRLLGLDGRGAVIYAPLLLLRPDALGTGTAPLTLLVDRVRGIQTADATALLPVSGESSFNGCVVAELADVAPATHLLAPERLVMEVERRAIIEYRAIAERRAGELAIPA